MKMGCLIGLSGGIGSGKSTVAKYLAIAYNFKILSFGSLLVDILKQEEKEVSRKNLQVLGNQLYDSLGPDGLTHMLLKDMKPQENCVIDGIRHLTIAEFLKDQYGDCFLLFYLEASEIVRFRRSVNRKKFNESLTFTEFKEREADPTEQDASFCLKEKANFIVDCSRGNEYCYRQIDNIIKEVIK